MRLIPFFGRLLFGNVTSKALLVLADGLAAYSLAGAAFGSFSVLQGLIISGAIVAVWGREQAVTNMIGRATSGNVDFRGYLRVTRQRVTPLSVVVALGAILIAEYSSVSFSPAVLAAAGLTVVLEAQLIVNAAVFRARGNAYAAILFLDGLRNLSLFLAAALVTLTGLGYQILIFFWMGAALLSLVIGSRRLSHFLGPVGGEPIPEKDLRHASDIVKFSGIWAVTRLVIAQVALIFSAYVLEPEELGTVAFLIKLLVAFIFLQSVMVQALSPVFGHLGRAENLAQARRVYDLTTLFLAASVAPAIGLALLIMDWIIAFFGVAWSGPDWVLALLFFVQALNIGTGVIGHFMIHFGLSKQLLVLSTVGAVLQFLLLWMLGQRYGLEGVLVAQALASLFLLLGKNVLAARRIGLHGFHSSNLTIIGVACLSYMLADGLALGMPGIGPGFGIGAYVVTCLSCVAIICLPRAREIGVFRRKQTP